MKKFSRAVLAAISILSITALRAAEEQPVPFEDKPALTRAELMALGVVPGISSRLGSFAGMRVGWRAGRRIGKAVESKIPWEAEEKVEAAGGGIGASVLPSLAPLSYRKLGKEKYSLTGESAGYEPIELSKIGEEVGKEAARRAQAALMYTPAIGGALAGYYVGGKLGQKGAQSAVIQALALLHGVSYRVESISQYYNINVSQYRRILIAASLHNPDALIQATDELFPLRFGADWNKRIERLFKKYRKRAEILLKPTTVTRKKDIRDFVRMVELGAAMANLYYGTKPDPKNTVDSAIQLYKELGLLK